MAYLRLARDGNGGSVGSRKKPLWGAANLSFAVVALLLVIAACGNNASATETKAATGSPYAVGAIGSFGGVFASSTTEVEVAIKAWAKWTNSHGGINGHPVKLTVMSDSADPATSIADVHQLVEQDHVIALFDYSYVDGTWASYVQQQGVPVVGAAVFDTYFQTNPDFFPDGTTVNAGLYGQLLDAKHAGYTNFGLASITTVSAATSTIAWFKAHTSDVGLKFGYLASLPTSAPNYTAQCLGAKGAGVQAMYLATASTQALQVLGDCAKQNYKLVDVTTSLGINSSWLSAPQADGTIAESPVVPISDTSLPALRTFIQAMHSTSPQLQFGGPAEVMWTAGQLFAAAAKAGKLGNHPTTAQVVHGLYALHNETLGGLAPPLTFKSGKPTIVNCSFVYKISHGKFTTPNGNKLVCAPRGVS